MNQFRAYQSQVNQFDEKIHKYELEAKQANDITLAVLTIICSNYFMTQMVKESLEKLRKTPQFYNKKLKSACEDVLSGARTLDRNLSNDIITVVGPEYIQCIANMCDSLDETMIPLYRSLVNEMTRIFKDEYNLENPEELSLIFSSDLVIFVANDISNQITEKYARIATAFAKLLDVNRLKERSNKMCSLAALRTPVETHINLNKHLEIIAKKKRLYECVTKEDTFAKAFSASGFVLDKEE